jgi:hypothetical protein
LFFIAISHASFIEVCESQAMRLSILFAFATFFAAPALADVPPKKVVFVVHGTPIDINAKDVHQQVEKWKVTKVKKSKPGAFAGWNIQFVAFVDKQPPADEKLAFYTKAAFRNKGAKDMLHAVKLKDGQRVIMSDVLLDDGDGWKPGTVEILLVGTTGTSEVVHASGSIQFVP